LFKAYGLGPYAESIKKLEDENKDMLEKINKLTGISYQYYFRYQRVRYWTFFTCSMESCS
jgi:hypothetical protein